MVQCGGRIPLTGAATLFIVRGGKALSNSYTVNIKRRKNMKKIFFVVAFGIWKRIKP